MSPVVVDTNVGVAANGDAKVDPACQLACVERLERAMTNGVVAVDDGGQIFDEYRKLLQLFWLRPVVGHVFFKYVHDRQYIARARVRRFVDHAVERTTGVGSRNCQRTRLTRRTASSSPWPLWPMQSS